MEGSGTSSENMDLNAKYFVERQYGGTERMSQNPPETVVEVASHALFGMLRTDEPEYKKTVLVAFRINGNLTWGVGVFISLGAELWFRYDGTHQGIPIHTPGADTPMVGWMYLPNAELRDRQ